MNRPRNSGDSRRVRVVLESARISLGITHALGSDLAIIARNPSANNVKAAAMFGV